VQLLEEMKRKRTFLISIIQDYHHHYHHRHHQSEAARSGSSESRQGSSRQPALHRVCRLAQSVLLLTAGWLAEGTLFESRYGEKFSSRHVTKTSLELAQYPMLFSRK
jgi:hypothetical protein